jgi:hypothetical protein
LLDEAKVAFPHLQFWLDKAVDQPNKFRQAEMMVKFHGNPPVWREFRNISKPLEGLEEIGKYRLYADVRGDDAEEERVRNFCRSNMALA